MRQLDAADDEARQAALACELRALLATASTMRPTSGKEAAVLVRLSTISLGLDGESGEPGHVALQSVISYLEGN